ncbi:MAG: hypothetical protein U1E20_00990 [Methylocystis sp.]|uniref:hypothetical protein n=1 Tax=Methylocystis sp. TaxID=1911079 RepID=UPI0039453F95
MGDEKGFQRCDALRAGDAMLIETLVFRLPRLSVHEKETVKLKRRLAPRRVAPAQQWGNNSEDVIPAPKFMIRKS